MPIDSRRGIRIVSLMDNTNITDAQIETLRTEAGAAGDRAQVALCTAALNGDTAAREACAEVIAEAQAQA